MSVGIIGGTGLCYWDGAESLGSAEIVDTPYGKTSAPLEHLAAHDVPFTFLARHGNPHSVPPHKINYRANLYALKQAGAERIVAVNAVGGIGEHYGANVLCVASDIIDYSSGREHTYYDGDSGHELGGSLDHVDFTFPYDNELRQEIIGAAQKQAIDIVDGGVYACTNGPRLESAAEVRRIKQDGGDVIGMTGMPEAALARELGLSYASLCLVVNPAAGETDALITMDDINKVVESGMGRVRSILSTLITSL